MKIGIVDFLNAYPLCYGLEDLEELREVSIVRDIPSRLSEKLQRGELDVALISSIEYHRHRDRFDYLPELCISSRGEVHSILLFVADSFIEANPAALEKDPAQSKTPFRIHPPAFTGRLKQDDAPFEILYDRATRSSLELVRILLKEAQVKRPVTFTEVAPPHSERIENLKENQLLLLIGDEALQNQNHAAIDLGSWHEETFHLPAVYALWAFDKTKPHGDPSVLLLNAWRKVQANPDKMIARAVERYGFEEEFTRRYLTEVIGYEMGPDERAGLKNFFEKYEELG